LALAGRRPDIIAALKRWSRSATDPVLSYLARSLFDRYLFKEVHFDGAEVESVRAIAKDAVLKALKHRATSDLPAVDAADKEALDYFVLVDTCDFKKYSHFDGILFDCGEAVPRTFDKIQKRPEYNIVSGQRPFTRTRIFVPSDVLSSVKVALRELEKK
jgi:hypothetical protein